MRRFYVRPDHRELGAGRLMAERLIEGARHHAMLLTVNAGRGAAGFWERVGFVAIDLETHTHELRL